jgi:hypothetical protein
MPTAQVITQINTRISQLNQQLAQEIVNQNQGGVASVSGISQINIITNEIQALNIQLNTAIGQQRVEAAETARAARETQEEMFWTQHLEQQGYESNARNAIESMLSELRILLYRLIALGTPIGTINTILFNILRTANLAISSIVNRELTWRFYVDCKARVLDFVQFCTNAYYGVCSHLPTVH